MAATGVALEDAAGLAAPHILLVDDNPDDRALAIRVLRQAFPAIRVTEVRQAAEFERALAAEACDVVVTDYLLCWSDGLTVLRRAKVARP